MNVAEVPLFRKSLGQHASSAARLPDEDDARRFGREIIVVGRVLAMGVERGRARRRQKEK